MIAVLMGAILALPAAVRAGPDDGDDQSAPPADSAQPPPAAIAPEPPVPWYQRAYLRSKDIRLDEDQWMAIYDFDADPSCPPSDEVRRNIDRFAPVISRARRGSLRPAPDHPADPISGFEQKTDHLAAARSLTRLIGYDLQVRLFDDDQPAVGERLATLSRLANHAASDRTLIASLVGFAIFAFAERRTDLALEHAAIGPGEAAVIVRALETLKADDPFHFRDSIARERAQVTGWMLAEFSGEGGLDRMQENDPVLASLDGVARTQIAEMTQPELDDALRRSDDAMAGIVAAFLKPDPAAAQKDLDALGEQVARGDFGPLAPSIVGAYPRVYSQMLDSRAKVGARLGQMRSIVDGTFDLDSLANAAVWYIRAADALAAVSESKMKVIRAYAAAHTEPADPKLLDILSLPEIQSIIATLRRAASLERCEFSSADSSPTILVRRHQPGMRDLARLLEADAARWVHQHDRGTPGAASAAAQRLAIGYRLCAHLGRDGSIISALTALRCFLAVDALASPAIDGHTFSDQDLEALRKAVGGFGKGDPFGFATAITAERHDVLALLNGAQNRHDREAASKAARGAGGEAAGNAAEDAADARPLDELKLAGRSDLTKEFVDSRTVDDLMWLHASFSAEYPRQSAMLLDRLALLDDVIAIPAHDEAAAQHEALLPMIEQARFEELIAVEHQPLAEVEARQREARRSLGAAVERFKKLK